MNMRNISECNGENPLISIIVPVYKVAPYLRQCVDSILAQTFPGFELILVDDGSPDNCGAICDAYKNADSRVIVIHQENKGLSAARNAGLDWAFAHSSSSWITFVDSDDFVVPDYLEILYRHAVETEADIVCTGATFFQDGTQVDPCRKVISVQCISGREACRGVYTDGTVSVFAWGKLYKKKLFQSVRFPEGKIYEDQFVIPQMLYQTTNIAVLRAWLYCYRQRAGSILHSAFSLARYHRIEGLDSCIFTFSQCGETEIAEKAKKKKRLYMAVYRVRASWKRLGKQIPEQYKMPLWKAYMILLEEVSRRLMKRILSLKK